MKGIQHDLKELKANHRKISPEARRKKLRTLVKRGISQAAIAKLLKISRQRVSQVVNASSN